MPRVQVAVSALARTGDRVNSFDRSSRVCRADLVRAAAHGACPPVPLSAAAEAVATRVRAGAVLNSPGSRTGDALGTSDVFALAFELAGPNVIANVAAAGLNRLSAEPVRQWTQRFLAAGFADDDAVSTAVWFRFAVANILATLWQRSPQTFTGSGDHCFWCARPGRVLRSACASALYGHSCAPVFAVFAARVTAFDPHRWCGASMAAAELLWLFRSFGLRRTAPEFRAWAGVVCDLMAGPLRLPGHGFSVSHLPSATAAVTSLLPAPGAHEWFAVAAPLAPMWTLSMPDFVTTVNNLVSRPYASGTR